MCYSQVQLSIVLKYLMSTDCIRRMPLALIVPDPQVIIIPFNIAGHVTSIRHLTLHTARILHRRKFEEL
jgi:hypothetical protein